ncbi:MAG TPA: PEP/pyruvate-binding domain-containing protein [Pyrinomonadaceae bacterium]|nr:PEP/pyruvate-binding domain-containing protein [Pyrinomonadaceae bacterium]
MTTAAVRAAPVLQSTGYIVPLDEATLPELVGGKAYNLCRISQLGLRVPSGFVVTAPAFASHLEENDLTEKIRALPQWKTRSLPGELGLATQRQLSARIRDLIVNTSLSPKLSDLLAASAEALLSRGPVVVRSSAVGEDSERASFAGQLDSILHVRTLAGLENALLACWASCWSERAIAYRAARGFEVRGMGVVVQTQVDAVAAGVLFTRTAAGTILVEYTPGLGDALVAGAIDPGRFVLQRDGTGFQALSAGERSVKNVENQLFSRARRAELARLAAVLEKGLGGAQDVEWAIDQAGSLQIVQSRPITASVTVNAPLPHGRPVRWSDANINENFPEPVSPFLYSIASAGYAHYFRNLAHAFGLSQRRIAAMDDALRHIIGVHGARMYYNLTNIHTVLRTAPFGDALVAAFNSFVGANGSLGAPPVKSNRLREFAELVVIALKTSWLYLFLGRRVASFERLVDDFAERTEPQRLASLPLRDLRLLLNELMDIRCHRWINASLADAAAMVCYAMLRRQVEQVSDGKSGALHNTLLKAIPQLVSGEPVQHLWELSRAVRTEPVLRTLFECEAESVVDQLAVNPEFADFRARFEEYLQRWGFRCSAELMLTAPSFQEQPELLVETIRAYARLDGESPDATLSRQLAERELETRRLLRKLRGRPISWWLPFVSRAAVLRTVLRWTQAAIAYRERARLKQALLYSRCRRVALALGDRLVARGHLARQEDVFWLTVTEVDELAGGSAMFPHHVQELAAFRKRAHERLAAMHPADNFTLSEGEYLPLDGHTPGNETWPRNGHANPANGGSRTLRGAGACGGCVTGRAVVLSDASEAGRLAAEDILITRQTDPGWAPVFFLIKGLVIERGGMLSHGAIVAREFGIPCVVGVAHATRELFQAGEIEVDGDRGEVHVLD